ncbi:hypothetical protein K469DRAFT_696377 [Zopfia rhizophila CBS 207.26]|uniref:Uncharacterized protein n=1 Tax=Zopfia rhizophila CBS 207.26 TaxID=1314779 RepID=A0A6A6DE38_9PEZI|nr:hypothetical protein K469DRAFT_696377 [Zopfia rhizophila CBS 207.26]
MSQRIESVRGVAGAVSLSGGPPTPVQLPLKMATMASQIFAIAKLFEKIHIKLDANDILFNNPFQGSTDSDVIASSAHFGFNVNVGYCLKTPRTTALIFTTATQDVETEIHRYGAAASFEDLRISLVFGNLYLYKYHPIVDWSAWDVLRSLGHSNTGKDDHIDWTKPSSCLDCCLIHDRSTTLITTLSFEPCRHDFGSGARLDWTWTYNDHDLRQQLSKVLEQGLCPPNYPAQGL